MESFRSPLHPHRGFSLIELLVTATIITLIALVIFSGQSQFSSTVLLSSTAYDIALTIRDAQTYGLGTRSQLGVANAGYGIDLKRGITNSYVLFADSDPAPAAGLCHPLPINGAAAPNAYPGNCIYTANDALVATYKLGSGMKISDFCVYNGAWSCATSHGLTLTQLDLVFSRPNGTAYISTNGTTYSAANTQACLTVTSPTNTSKYISINSVGQIVANAPSCP